MKPKFKGKKRLLKRRDTPDAYNVFHGPVITDRRSTFQAHACKLHRVEDIPKVYETLLGNKKVKHAKHNIWACRIRDKNGLVSEEFSDDGENQAGDRLMHLLQMSNVVNVMVVVTRWYGGIHIGPDRFKHYNDAALEALVLGEFMNQNESY